METMERSLNMQQAYESALKNQENENKETEMMRQAASRFGGLSLGCLLYSAVYAFCMYQNKEGITFPFFVGATLYFFYYFTKKYCVTMPNRNRFLTVGIVLLGIITCTTTSDFIIFCNKVMILLLLCVMLLRMYHDVTGWSVGNYLCAASYVVFGAMGYMFTPVSDVGAYIKVRNNMREKRGISDDVKQRVMAIGTGIVIAIPMMLFVGMMLGSADVYFYQIFENAFELLWDLDWDFFELFSDGIRVFLCIVLMFLLSYGAILYINKRKGIEELVHREKTKWDSFVAITFCSLIGVMYLLFVWIQIVGLFMGKLEIPHGYTYAEYAREGFFQLVFVCLFNVCLVLVCHGCFKKHKILQILLTVISLCTYVMLVSSAYRMFLYIGEYHLTFLRVLVLWAIVVIAVVMIGVVLAIYKEEFPLFMYLLVCVTSLYIGFGAIHPDYVIAKYNIAQKEAGKEIDRWYLLEGLSMDAASPIFGMLEKEGYVTDLEKRDDGYTLGNDISCFYWNIIEETSDMKIRDFNFSKGIAKYSAIKYAERMK